MNIITENGVQYAEFNCRSVAEVVGLAPKGSSKPLRFPVIGYEKDEVGNMVPCLGIKMISDERYSQLAKQQAMKTLHSVLGMIRKMKKRRFSGRENGPHK